MEKLIELLPLNLQYFAEEGADSSDGTENTGEQAPEQKEHMIPKSRFDSVNQRAKDLQAQLDAFTAEKAEAERKSKEEAGEFKTLYESAAKESEEAKGKYGALEQRNKELEGVVAELLQAKLEGISEEYHDLIPDNLTPEAKLAWVAKAEQKGLFGKKQQKPVGSQTNGGENPGITKDQFTKMSYAERTALFETNPELYKSLSK